MRIVYAGLFCLVVMGAFWAGYATGFVTARDYFCGVTMENLLRDSGRPVEA